MSSENVPWNEGIRRLREFLQAEPTPWGGAELRMLVWPFPENTDLGMIQPFILYIQAIFERVEQSELSTLVDEPLILEARITRSDLLALVKGLDTAATVTFGDWRIKCAGIASVNTQLWISCKHEVLLPWMRLVDPIVIDGQEINPYGYVASGRGSEQTTELTNLLVSTANLYNFANAADFTLHYLGVAVQGPAYGPWLAVVLLQPIWLTAGAENQNAVRARLWFRSPLSPDQFWLRGAATKWSLGMERLAWGPTVGEDRGWMFSEYVFSIDPGTQNFTVWTGRDNAPELSVEVPLSPVTREQEREAIVGYLYGAVKKRLSDDLLPDPAKPPRAEDFELAIANLLASLGYAIINTGKPLQTKAVDLIGFDAGRDFAIVVSVTTGNDVERKLRGLVGVRALSDEMLSQWRCRYVIVTSAAAAAILLCDKRACAEEGVALVAREDLACLEDGDFACFERRLSELLGSSLPSQTWP